MERSPLRSILVLVPVVLLGTTIEAFALATVSAFAVVLWRSMAALAAVAAVAVIPAVTAVTAVSATTIVAIRHCLLQFLAVLRSVCC